MRPPVTYDPILGTRTLARFRLLEPIKPPGAGEALVLLPYRGAPETIRNGEQIPGSYFGTYERGYLVDLAEYRLSFDASLVSEDPSFSFHARTSISCRVADPAVVVARNIRDVTAALQAVMYPMMRSVARHFDVTRLHPATDALQSALGPLRGDAAFHLRAIDVELLPDPEASRRGTHDLYSTRREHKIRSVRREYNLEMMHKDGAEGLLAEILEKEGPRAALEWIKQAEVDDRAELRHALETMLGRSGRRREDFDLREAEEILLDRLHRPPNVPFGGTAPSRVRGIRPSIERGVHEGRVHRGEEPTEPDDDDPPPARPSRVRFHQDPDEV